MTSIVHAETSLGSAVRRMAGLVFRNRVQKVLSEHEYSSQRLGALFFGRCAQLSRIGGQSQIKPLGDAVTPPRSCKQYRQMGETAQSCRCPSAAILHGRDHASLTLPPTIRHCGSTRLNQRQNAWANNSCYWYHVEASPHPPPLALQLDGHSANTCLSGFTCHVGCFPNP